MNIQLQKLVERKGLFVDIRLLVQIVGFSHLKYFYRLCIGMLLQIIVNDFFFFWVIAILTIIIIITIII